MSPSQLDVTRIIAPVLFAPVREIGVRDLTTKNIIPIDHIDQFADLRGIIPHRVQPAHEAAHTCTRDEVDGNPVFLQPAEYSNVRQT
jgi:hypothetical protein